MDSIEKMRRLNELTKNLKQHGFAESSFEAIQQANQIYGNEEVTSDVKNGMIRNKSEGKITSNSDDVPQEINNTTHNKLTQLTENVDTLTTKMNEIIKAINDLDLRIQELKSRPQVQERIVERTVEREHERPQPATTTTQEQKPTEKTEDTYNQRIGSFQSNDVAIDKMFYFGKK